MEDIPMQDDEHIALSSVDVDSRSAISKKIAIGSLAICLLLSLVTTVSAVTHKSSQNEILNNMLNSLQSQTDTSPTFDTSWVPDGFTIWPSDSNVAYQWVADPVCNDYTCNQATFISQNGCPANFYAALNFLDSSDSVIGYTNATLPSLLPMQKAILRFEDTSNSAASAQMSDITCQ